MTSDRQPSAENDAVVHDLIVDALTGWVTKDGSPVDWTKEPRRYVAHRIQEALATAGYQVIPPRTAVVPMTLTDFLLEQIADEEAELRGISSRARAEVEFKRTLLDLVDARENYGVPIDGDAVLAAMAKLYRHPDYREAGK